MTLTPKTIAVALALSFVIAVAVSEFTSTKQSIPSQSEKSATRTTEESSLFDTKEHIGGNVTVIVTPREMLIGKAPTFDVVFETHSVDLDFNAATVATLSDDRGTTYGPPAWGGSPPGGHHRKGLLTFSRKIPTDTQQIKLTISDVANIPVRAFVWTVNIK